jgi:hypothetical protein
VGGHACGDRVVDGAVLVGQAERDRRAQAVGVTAVTERQDGGAGQVLDRSVDGVVGAERLGQVEEVGDALRTGLAEGGRGQTPRSDESFEGVVRQRPESGGQVGGGRHRPVPASGADVSEPSGWLVRDASR